MVHMYTCIVLLSGGGRVCSGSRVCTIYSRGYGYQFKCPRMSALPLFRISTYQSNSNYELWFFYLQNKHGSNVQHYSRRGLKSLDLSKCWDISLQSSIINNNSNAIIHCSYNIQLRLFSVRHLKWGPFSCFQPHCIKKHKTSSHLFSSPTPFCLGHHLVYFSRALSSFSPSFRIHLFLKLY